MGAGWVQGKEAVPEAVDHVLVPVDPREDRSWLQSQPAVSTDNAHRHDSTGPNIDSAANWSEAVKRLKPRVLQRLIDAHKCAACLLATLPSWVASALCRPTGKACRRDQRQHLNRQRRGQLDQCRQAAEAAHPAAPHRCPQVLDSPTPQPVSAWHRCWAIPQARHAGHRHLTPPTFDSGVDDNKAIQSEAIGILKRRPQQRLP